MALVAASMIAKPLELAVATSPAPKASTGALSPQSAMKEKNAAKLRDTAVTMQLTKTKMCAFFARGKCASSNCRYAHCQEELRSAPNLQKTKLCRAFLAGHCNDENCFYAHGEGDLRVTEGIYKTQMCNFFERGYCKKGDRCNHAHGKTDLHISPPSASTPMGKTSLKHVDSAQPRRSPLPLSELLVIDSEANSNMSTNSTLTPDFNTMPLSPSFSTMPPTPTKSVAEMAQLAFSPVHSTPLWAQYGMHSLSPAAAMNPMHDLAAMWAPRDAVDMLVQPSTPIHMSMMYGLEDQHVGTPMNLMNMYAMEAMAMEPQLAIEHPPPVHSPDLSPMRPAPGLYAATPMSPPGLEVPTQPAAESKDPLMVNLSERLASLDAVVLGLGNDIAQIKSDPNKRLHRI